MDREGIEIWNTYVLTNNWTWDTFLEIARQTTKDFDGDGIVDQWGILADTRYFVEGFIFANGGRYLNYDDTSYTIAFKSPQSMRAMQFVSDLINVYGVSKKVGATATLKPYKGKYAMTVGHIQILATLYPTPDIGQDVWMAPFPKGPDKGEYMQGYRLYQDQWVFPANMDKKSDVVKVCTEWVRMNYLGLVETNPLKTSASIWYKNMNPANLDRILWLRDNYEGTNEVLADVFKLGAYATTNIFPQIMDLQTSVASALAANEPVMQNMIDTAMQQ